MKMIHFLILFLLMPIVPIFSDIITLTNESIITCVVTGSSEQGAVYLNPPVKTGFIKAPTVEVNNWVNDDWSIEDSDSFFYNPITDKRWEDFKFYDHTDGLILDKKPISLSVYVRELIHFKMFSQDWAHSATFMINKTSVNDSNRNWFHFILQRQNNTIQILVEDQIFYKKDIDFNGPYIVYMKTIDLNTTFYKVHDRQFRWSNESTNTTIDQQQSYVNVLFSDNLCLSMYVSIDEKSSLEVVLISTTRNIRMPITGFNQDGLFKKWKKIEIKANSIGNAQLSFNRTNEENKNQGYWAIDDIRFCTQETDIYHMTMPTSTTKDHTCERLNESNELTSNVSSIMSKPGFLGNLSCETILGPSYPSCESHKICLTGSSCLCSWGYQGHSCDKTCDEGRGGQSCTQECVNCTKCDPSTGACLSKKSFPKNISLSFRQFLVELPNYEDIYGEPTYNFKYVCVSLNDIVMKETYTISTNSDYKSSLIHNFEKMVPFTQYKPFVTMTRNYEILEKSYPAIETQPELDTIENFIIYKHNDTNLWIKFRPTQKSFEGILNYKLWYSENFKEITANDIDVFKCERWSDFLCGRISNLKCNTTYNIIVAEKNLLNGKTKISVSIAGSTSKEDLSTKENRADKDDGSRNTSTILVTLAIFLVLYT